ncbi:Uncharacterised protein [Mycobacteroides abscessus subsp. abscessus]|nr:Uncharacterised protein [Mycobacteroides abscessus subsp. abscessus]
MPLEALPGWLQSIGKWLPSYHYANGAWEVLSGNLISLENIFYLGACTVLFMILSSYILKKRDAV